MIRSIYEDTDEFDWIGSIVANMSDNLPKLAYADWLDERGQEQKAAFVRSYVEASNTMQLKDFPKPKKLPEQWLDLMGFRLLEKMAKEGFPELKEPVLRCARPTLIMKEEAIEDGDIPTGASKIGGLPDLPPEFKWPIGDECPAIYNSDTKGVESLAGFLAQINCSETINSQAGRMLPNSGLLSFFGYQDIENDDPDIVGVGAFYFPDQKGLIRTKPPKKLTEGNDVIQSHQLELQETLDLPETDSSLWEKDLKPNADKDYSNFYEHFRDLNFHNILGYARSTGGGDPTPSKQSRHLISLVNSVGCRLHIQIHEDDLAKRNFGAIKLVWVDFD